MVVVVVVVVVVAAAVVDGGGKAGSNTSKPNIHTINHNHIITCGEHSPKLIQGIL